MKRIILTICLIVAFAACAGKSKTDVKVKHPSGAEGELHHESDRPAKD